MNKFALISDGESKQGSKVVRKFLALGYNVAACCKTLYGLESLLDITHTKRHCLIAKRVDMTNHSEVRIFYNEALLLYGRPSVLVNNLSHYSNNSSDDNDPLLATAYSAMTCCVVGQMYLTSLCVRDVKIVEGTIINVGYAYPSTLVRKAIHDAANACMETFTLSISKEYDVDCYMVTLDDYADAVVSLCHVKSLTWKPSKL